MKEDYLPSDDEILLFNKKELTVSGAEATEAIVTLLKVIDTRPKSIINELNIYRKYVPKLIEWCRIQQKLCNASHKEADRVTQGSEDKKYKRWTKEEDELLIERVCKEDMSLLQLSTTFGRTPSSIKTRITELVGVKRLSQNIAGRFVGEINGETVNTKISGKLFRE